MRTHYFWQGIELQDLLILKPNFGAAVKCAATGTCDVHVEHHHDRVDHHFDGLGARDGKFHKVASHAL